MILTAPRLAQRDGGAFCWHCGTTETLTVQHRANRGAGGRRSAETPSNGLLLCWAVNVALEADAALAKYARAAGWKVSKWADTTAVPAYDATTATWWLLGDDWSRTRA